MDIDATNKWKKLLAEIEDENDPKRLQEKVMALEDELWRCQQELLNRSDRQEECDEIKRAIEKLYAVKVKRLGFPDPMNQLSN